MPHTILCILTLFVLFFYWLFFIHALSLYVACFECYFLDNDVFLLTLNRLKRFTLVAVTLLFVRFYLNIYLSFIFESAVIVCILTLFIEFYWLSTFNALRWNILCLEQYSTLQCSTVQYSIALIVTYWVLFIYLQILWNLLIPHLVISGSPILYWI